MTRETRKSRKTFAEYAKIVAEYGTRSPEADAFLRAHGTNTDFAQLARLTDFLFDKFDDEDAHEERPTVVVQTG